MFIILFGLMMIAGTILVSIGNDEICVEMPIGMVIAGFGGFLMTAAVILGNKTETVVCFGVLCLIGLAMIVIGFVRGLFRTENKKKKTE
jgi:hypothetical protein